MSSRTIAASRPAGWAILLSGVVGLIAAATLLIERIELLKNPDYVPTCSISPILSCGSVMQTWQAALFGFPNPIIGVAAFPVVIAAGVIAVAGIRMPGWWWSGLVTGALAGVVFVHWLAFESLYDIDTLCPYCMVVWVATIVAFVASASVLSRAGRLPRFIAAYAPSIVVLWLAVFVVAIFLRFQDYWLSLI